ncbi:MAG: phosphatase PAP2 family protein [Actinomycetota bacterium]
MSDPSAAAQADPSTVPGEGALGPAIERFDRAVDEAFDRVRGNEALDQLFRAASTAGDFSLVWHALGGMRGLATRRADQVLILAVGLGLESLIVNQCVKRLFRRSRPTEHGVEGLEVRQPTTSSFPSGHASAATFAVVLLSAWERPSRIAGWAAVGILVATSRVYVRIHHASDVLGGIAIGAGLGFAARRVARRIAPR